MNFIQSLLRKILNVCHKCEEWMTRYLVETDENANTRYGALTPKYIADDTVSEYFNALDFAFSRNDVKNIAVTGSYGAGKSTVIFSYLKKNYNDEYINVSLAGFDMSGQEGTVSPTPQEVEMSILQQILYKKNRDALPDSRIDRIQNRNANHTWSVFYSMLKLFIPLLAFSTILFLDKFNNYLKIPDEWSQFFNEHTNVRLVVLIILFLISLLSLTRILSGIGIFDKKVNLNKIAFLSGEVEFNKQETSSLLNNCLDEIVYFFSKLTYRVVVFEDLDRLGTPEIFVKLREINKIVNNNIPQDNPVRFIYAVRDDIFLGADVRTKFFDFIMPVIPVMDSRNAYSLLTTKMGSFPAEGGACLRHTAPYITDMRSLQNITNEYNIFCEIVDNKTDSIKLYALVFYKNIYSQDYSLTDKLTGVLYSFVRDYRTRKLHEYYFTRLENDLSALNEKLILLSEEKEASPEEVRNSIICRMVPKSLWGMIFFSTPQRSNGYGLSYSSQDGNSLVSNEDTFMSYFSGEGKVIIGYRSANNYVEIPDEEKQEVSKEYQERKSRTGEIKEKSYRDLLLEIGRKKEEIRRRNSISLGELIKLLEREKFEELAVSYLNDMKQHDYVSKQQLNVLSKDMRNGGFNALYLLLRDGYLQQDFMMYRSIFHKGAISENDNDYLKLLGQDPSYVKVNADIYIDNEELVISEIIAQNRIHHEGALHYQIIEKMMSMQDAHLNEMIATLFGGVSSHIIGVFSVLHDRFSEVSSFDNFVVISLETNRYLDKMISVLRNIECTDIVADISVSMISQVSPEISLDKEAYRKFVMSSGSGLLSLLRADNAKGFMEKTRQLSVSYDELITPISEIEIDSVNFIAQNNMYRITRHNISVVLSVLLRDKNVSLEEINSTPFTLIVQHTLTPVQEFIDRQIDVFVREVFILSDEKTDSIITMLNHPQLSDAMKANIVRSMTFALDELSQIADGPDTLEQGNTLSYHDLFYCYDRVAPAWTALQEYLLEECDLNTLTNYVTRHVDILCQNGPGSLEGEEYDQLFVKIICNETFDDDVYSRIMKHVEVLSDRIDARLTQKGFTRLVMLNKLPLEEETFIGISDLYIAQYADLRNIFLTWFIQYKDVFMGNTDLFLRKEDNETFFCSLMADVLNNIQFREDERAGLVIQYQEVWLSDSEPVIAIPLNIMLLVINTTDSEVLKIKMIAMLMHAGYKNKTDISTLVNKLSEPELSRIFNNKREASVALTNSEIYLPLLESLKEGEIINKYELMEDGKYHISIWSRQYNEEE